MATWVRVSQAHGGCFYANVGHTLSRRSHTRPFYADEGRPIGWASHARPQQRDTHAAQCCSASGTVYRGGAYQTKVTLNRHSTSAEGDNQKAPANQEHMDCCSAICTYTDFQAGRGTLHAKDGHCATAARVLSASKRTYDAIFGGNLTLNHVAASDEPFLATNNRAGRRALFSDDRGGSRSQQRRRPAS